MDNNNFYFLFISFFETLPKNVSDYVLSWRIFPTFLFKLLPVRIFRTTKMGVLGGVCCRRSIKLPKIFQELYKEIVDKKVHFGGIRWIGLFFSGRGLGEAKTLGEQIFTGAIRFSVFPNISKKSFRLRRA